MIRWLRKWMAFFSPVSGWKERLLAFRAGQTAWEVPGKPECNNVIPWPLEWVPHRLYGPDEDLSPEEAARGFEMTEVHCGETGRPAAVGESSLCARCGIALHPDSCRTSGFKAPACKRCSFLIFLVR